MVRVVLITGKVLVYHQAGSIAEEGASYALRTEDDKYLIARVPVVQVERVEFEPPCAILREPSHRRAKVYR